MEYRNTKNKKKNLLCLTYVENIFSRRISEIVKNKDRKNHYAKQSFSLRFARNLMAALHERMHKYEHRLVWHLFMLFLGSTYNFSKLKNPHARHNNVTINLDDKLVQVFGPQRSGGEHHQN
ncbi:hypothetical protein HID58_074453 [Brassica napus]|uniref:Uncharacterized protein n=1 Tax=Brassica napus TaxID=3708 RepID=A0ABQ7YJW0_BRANA|nr:hypothetical protein HID58_074453 [Brassica napus]